MSLLYSISCTAVILMVYPVVDMGQMKGLIYIDGQRKTYITEVTHIWYRSCPTATNFVNHL